MVIRLSTFLLAVIFASAPLARSTAAQSQAKETAKVERIKSEITNRLKHGRQRVKLKLSNGVELKGRIDQADDNGFTITEDKTGKRTTLSYGEIEKVSGRGLSKGAKIGIAVAIGVGVLAIIAVIAIKNFDPFKGGLGHVPP